MARNKKLILVSICCVTLALIVRLFLWGEIRAWRYRNFTEVRVVNNSNWFDYPVGAPNARGYYRAQKFRENSHLGEDWNGVGGGNSDYGDPIYAIADGKVTSASDVQMGWGNVVRIVHHVSKDEYVEAVYAHLAGIKVHVGQQVRRGAIIGIMGDADGAYQAHLHFEIRTKVGLPLGGGYASDCQGFCDPSKFIDSHRKS